MTWDFDLFGDPIAAPVERRGRPRHVRSEAKAKRVRRLHDAGLNHLEIAKRIGISAPTLRLVYAGELNSSSTAAQRRRERDLSEGRAWK